MGSFFPASLNYLIMKASLKNGNFSNQDNNIENVLNLI